MIIIRQSQVFIRTKCITTRDFLLLQKVNNYIKKIAAIRTKLITISKK